MLVNDDLLLQDQSSQQQIYCSFINTFSLKIRAVNASIQLLLFQNIMTLNRILKIRRLLLLKSHKSVNDLRKIVEAAISNIDLKYIYVSI